MSLTFSDSNYWNHWLRIHIGRVYTLNKQFKKVESMEEEEEEMVMAFSLEINGIHFKDNLANIFSDVHWGCSSLD